MKVHYESLTDFELVEVIELKDEISNEALSICLDILRVRDVSEMTRLEFAMKVYGEKVAAFYDARGFYSKESPKFSSEFLSNELKQMVVLKVFEEKMSHLNLNSGLNNYS